MSEFLSESGFAESVSAYASAPIEGSAALFLPSIVRQGLSEGYSGQQMLNTLRASGVPIDESKFYGYLSTVRGSELTQDSLTGLDVTAVPDDTLAVAMTTQRSSGYLYQIRAYGVSRDPLTGAIERTTRYFNVASQTQLSIGDVLQTALGYTTDGDQGEGSDATIVGLEVAGFYKLTPGR